MLSSTRSLLMSETPAFSVTCPSHTWPLMPTNKISHGLCSVLAETFVRTLSAFSVPIPVGDFTFREHIAHIAEIVNTQVALA